MQEIMASDNVTSDIRILTIAVCFSQFYNSIWICVCLSRGNYTILCDNTILCLSQSVKLYDIMINVSKK